MEARPLAIGGAVVGLLAIGGVLPLPRRAAALPPVCGAVLLSCRGAAVSKGGASAAPPVRARRRREIRMGKRPLLMDGESSSGFPTSVFGDVPLPSTASSLPSTASSPFASSRLSLPELSARSPVSLFGHPPLPSNAPSRVVPSRLLLPVDYVVETVLLPDLQYCLGPACSLVTSYPTPSVPLNGPPFSDKCIAMLKALSSERSYYGVPAYTCEKCGALFWHYNSLFAFTSMGADVDRTINSGGAPYIFKMGGCAYHRIGSLLPRGTDAPKFAQLYMVDSADEVQCRLDLFGREDIVGEGGCFESADPLIVRELTEMLDHHNHLVQHFRFARRRLQSSDCPNVVIRFFGDEGGSHGTRFSGPTACEVAALIVGDLTPAINRFDVVAETHSHELRQVSSLNPSLMALQYPLLFPYDLYVVEFQKRGLPHTHTLIWLKRNTKEPSSALIDSFVSAELPDPEKDPLGYVLVDEFMPSVERLVVHLPGMNRVIFHENQPLASLVDRSLFHKTMLTEWFVANENHPEARDLTYLDFPTGWVWNASQKVWTKRRQKRKIATRIGRIYHVHPSTGELFFLRMLLLVATGATCFEDLRRYNGILHNSFKAACQARGLVGDDNEWFNLFEEAIVWATPFQLRHLFMTVLLYCEVINGDKLFDRYWHSMGEDISYRISTSLPGYVVPDVHIQDEVLKELSAMFARNGSSLASFNISSRPIPADGGPYNRLIAEETYYDLQQLSVEGEAMRQNLNVDQSLIFSQIMYSIDTDTPKVYFVSGHGGTGKTFLWNCIVTVLRSERRIVLAVASSGVASLLLPNGRTAHSRFRIPLNANDKSQCNISRGSTMAALLQETSLILWDEAPMTSRYCFEALDRTLRDVLSANDSAKSALPFGGKTVIFGGDFRQVLPVIEGGSRNEIIDASLIASPLWRHVTVLRLKENMRLKRPDISPSECEQLSLFAQWILDVGNGDVPGSTRDGEDSGSWITIPEDLLLLPPSSNMDTAIQSVYESFFFNYSSADYLAQRSILCPTNTVVDEINDSVFERVPGCARRYLSSDSISKSTDHVFDAELLFFAAFWSVQILYVSYIESFYW
ncbi:hypothetical protein ACQ4PT_071604 [Festuca glaucescens]